MIHISRLFHICEDDPKYVIYGKVPTLTGDVEWPGGYVRCPHCGEALPGTVEISVLEC